MLMSLFEGIMMAAGMMAVMAPVAWATAKVIEAVEKRG